MKTVMVSGSYRMIHAGHIEFWKQARALGDRLLVVIASDKTLAAYKSPSPMPEHHRLALVKACRYVDAARIGSAEDKEDAALNFLPELLNYRPDILAITEDDFNKPLKALVCYNHGVELVTLPKVEPAGGAITTTDLLAAPSIPAEVPLRVDFAGGWLDVPKLAIAGGRIVNCTITPMVSLKHWPYHKQAGLGGSAAHAILTGRDPFSSDMSTGAGWQDPAVIFETGLCVWESGPTPKLRLKRSPDLLQGRMALHWTGQPHNTASLVEANHAIPMILHAGHMATSAIAGNDLSLLADAIETSYRAQLAEGMQPLHREAQSIAMKYCGSGWGGYALYLFDDQQDRDGFCNQPDTMAIEPYIRQHNQTLTPKESKE